MNYNFKSHRAKLINDYIKYRRSFGYQYANVSIFYTMDNFFILMNKTDFIGLTKEECEQWSQKRSFEKKNTQCIRINKMINFCKYLKQMGYSSFQPFPIRYIKNFKPYIFSKDEIRESVTPYLVSV
jgi:hypothetical protein